LLKHFHPQLAKKKKFGKEFVYATEEAPFVLPADGLPVGTELGRIPGKRATTPTPTPGTATDQSIGRLAAEKVSLAFDWPCQYGRAH
jgi:ribosomal protein L1